MWTRNLCSNGLQWWYLTYRNCIVFNEKYQPNVKTVILFLFILNRTLFLIVEKLLQKIKQNQLAHHVAYRFICYIKFLCTYYLWNQIYHIMRFWTLDEETFSHDGIILNITLTITEYEKLINDPFQTQNISDTRKQHEELLRLTIFFQFWCTDKQQYIL